MTHFDTNTVDWTITIVDSTSHVELIKMGEDGHEEQSIDIPEEVLVKMYEAWKLHKDIQEYAEKVDQPLVVNTYAFRNPE